MRRLIALLLLSATSPGHGQADPCIPNLNPMALERVSVETQRCGLRPHSYVRESGSELAGTVTIGFDAGRNGDSIYWGIWNSEGTLGITEDRVDETIGSRIAMPYVAGVASRLRAIPR